MPRAVQTGLYLTLTGLLTACPSSAPTAQNLPPKLPGGSVTGTVSLYSPFTRVTALEPTEVLVRPVKGLGAQSLGTLSVDGQALEKVRSLGWGGVQVYRVPLGLSVTRALEKLRSSAKVLEVYPNYPVWAQRTGFKSLEPYQWNMAQIAAPEAWTHTNGAGIVVAVIDTGIVAHPEFQGRILPGIDMVSSLQNSGDGDGVDTNPLDQGGDSGYHGTHVAGIVAAAQDAVGVTGVAPQASLLPVRVLGVNGGGSLDEVLRGVAWAGGLEVEGLTLNPHPARIINLSLGSKRPCIPLEQELFAELERRNIAVVVAAGNDGQDASLYGPANCNHVLTVGATGPEGSRTDYSNWGAAIDLMAPGGNLRRKLGVPGELTAFPAGILSTLYSTATSSFDYGMLEGTSMAAPHVAGTLTLMMSRSRKESLPSLLERLKNTARPLTDLECRQPSGCGAGLIDANAALGKPGPRPTTLQSETLNTFMVAFFLSGKDFDPLKTRFQRLPIQGRSSFYSISGLETGIYRVGAFQDLNDNGEFEDAEPIGVYPQKVEVQLGRTQSNIDVQMETFTP